jgi:hypothetical protein
MVPRISLKLVRTTSIPTPRPAEVVGFVFGGKTGVEEEVVQI